MKYTKNGPVLEEINKESNLFGLSYKYKANGDYNAISYRNHMFNLKVSAEFQYTLMFAKSKEEFLPKLETYAYSLLALIWATDNEIGYTSIGQIPLKENKESKFCKGYVALNTKNIDETTGYIPRNETPVITNPKKGYIVTANNRNMPQNYKHYSQSYSYFSRFYRITQLLDSTLKNKKFSVQDSINILFDQFDLYSSRVAPMLVKIIERNWNNTVSENKQTLEKYLKMLKNFDFIFYKNSTTATLYSVFEYQLGKNLLIKNENTESGFENEIEARSALNVFNYWNFIESMIEKVLKYEDTSNIKNCNYYNKNSNCEKYIIETFEKLDQVLIENGYKKDGLVLPWSSVHFHYYPHAFDTAGSLLKKIFSRKMPTGGNKNTIKVAKSKPHDVVNGPFTSNHSANLKYICDMSDPTRPHIIIDTGNSGNVLSKFYDNLMEKSENNELIQIKDHEFNDDVHLLISFPEDNTLIIRNK